MTRQEDEKKEEAQGALKRILQKFTAQCNKGSSCTSSSHFHEEEDEGNTTERIGPANHQTLIVVPQELDVVNGIIEWDCLTKLEARHYQDGQFDLKRNALSSEEHHKCLTCLNYVVRLSGKYETPKSKRPCYKCMGLSPPDWYILEDGKSIVTDYDSGSEDEILYVKNSGQNPGPNYQHAVLDHGKDQPPTIDVSVGKTGQKQETKQPLAVASTSVDDEEPSDAEMSQPEELTFQDFDDNFWFVPSKTQKNSSSAFNSNQMTDENKQTGKTEKTKQPSELMSFNPMLWSVWKAVMCIFGTPFWLLALVPYTIYQFFFHEKEELKYTSRIRCEAKAVTPRIYMSVYVGIQLILPIGLIWASFDLFIWPGLCIWLTEVLTSQLGIPMSFFVGMTVFQAENVLTMLYGLMMMWIYNVIMKGFKVSREYLIKETEQPDVGDNPKKMSHGPVKYLMDIKEAEVYEICSYGFEPLQLSFDFYAVKLKTIKFSGTLFYDEAGTHSGARQEAALTDYLQKTFEKAGYIHWNRVYMTENNIISNTIEVVTAYANSLKKEEIDNPLSHLNLIIHGPTSYRPWWTIGHVHKILTLMTILSFIGGFVFMTYQFLRFLSLAAVFIYWVFSTLSIYALRLNDATKFPAANGEMPDGVFGFRVYDDITGRYEAGVWTPMKTNQVGENKELEISLDPKNIDPHYIIRTRMGAFSPFFIPGFAMPKGDLKCWLTFWCGLIHRGAGKTPTPDQSLLDSKREYAEEMLQCLIAPACEADVMNEEEALRATHYTEKRKEQIRNWERNAHEFDMTRGNVTAPFGKDEPKQETGKHDRTIQGGHETLWESGVFGSLGRFVKTMEHAIYSVIPSNIKMMTPAEQTEKIRSLGPGTKTVNDFSSYEASFSTQVQESAQFAAYDYYYQNTSYAEDVPEYARKILGDLNIMKSKYGTAKIRNLKCSGAFDTSFSNWFDNVCTICHIFWKKFQVHWTDALDWILCEGDDNITDDHGLTVTNKDFEPYGLTAKVETGLNLEEAGFVQRFISDAGTLLGDPIRYLGKSQYIPIQYIDAKMSKKLGMVKAKAMSTLSMMPDCPVISEHAWRVLELTKGVHVSQKMLDKAKKYGLDILDFSNFRPPVIKYCDRLAMSYVFDFSLERQEIVTKTLAKWTGGPLQLPVAWFPENWIQFYDEYATRDKESTLLSWGNDHFFDYFTGRLSEVLK